MGRGGRKGGPNKERLEYLIVIICVLTCIPLSPSEAADQSLYSFPCVASLPRSAAPRNNPSHSSRLTSSCPKQRETKGMCVLLHKKMRKEEGRTSLHNWSKVLIAFVGNKQSAR